MLSAADSFVTVVGLAVSAVGAFAVLSLAAVRFYEILFTTVHSAESKLRRLKKQKQAEMGMKAEESLA